MQKTGRPSKSEYEKRCNEKARERFIRLLGILSKEPYNLTQKALAERMAKSSKRSAKSIAETISKIKSGSEALSQETARLFCNSFNKYENDSIIHKGTDIRWQWLAGLDDELPTYKQAFHEGYLKDLEGNEEELKKRINKSWEENPQDLIEAALYNNGFTLVRVLSPQKCTQSFNLQEAELLKELAAQYEIKNGEDQSFILSTEEMERIEDEIRSFVSYLVEKELNKQDHQKNARH